MAKRVSNDSQIVRVSYLANTAAQHSPPRCASGMLRDVHPIPGKVRRSHGGGTAARRDGVSVFEQFAWPRVGSVKVAWSRPARQRVTLTVGRLSKKLSMKRFLFLTCIVLFSACQPLAVNSFTSTPNKTPIPSSTSTFTPAPSETPIPSETATPLPPKSFNPAIIPTLTLSAPAQCPKEDSSLQFNSEKAYSSAPPGEGNQYFTRYVLEFLNSGGTLQSISLAFEIQFFRVQDVTGDNISELIFPYGIWLDIFGCRNGKYELMFDATDISNLNGVDIIDITDINRDGLAEIIANMNGCMGNRCPTISVYEWNGQDFQDLIANPNSMNECSSLSVASFDVEIRDIDNNGTKEMILSNNGNPWPDIDFPYRKETRVCMWNGQNIVLYKTEFDAPYYRFQAVQDGDRATLAGDYDNALGFYQRTINDKKLQWFTQDRKQYDFWIYHSNYFAGLKEPTPTASPALAQDPNEYPSLAAYAYYRIMLLYIPQNDMANAEANFVALQNEFPSGSPGNYFTQVASVFWQEYQSAGSTKNSCNKVVEYIQEHPLPTGYLGDWDHGVHSIRYTPEAICPFR